MVRVQLKNTFKQHDLADDSEDNKHTYMYSAERRARAVMSSRKKKKSSAMATTKRIFSALQIGFVSWFPISNSVLLARHCQCSPASQLQSD